MSIATLGFVISFWEMFLENFRGDDKVLERNHQILASHMEPSVIRVLNTRIMTCVFLKNVNAVNICLI